MDNTELIRSVNTALQSFGTLVALAMITSFRSDMLRSRSQRLFFSKIIVATVCMICCLIYNLRGMTGDHLNEILLSLSHVGIYVVAYLYIEFLRAQIEEIDPEHPVPKAVS